LRLFRYFKRVMPILFPQTIHC
ncbi:putative transcriptional regulator domain protein, partial [Vibrio parahaemolyticus V-223/04]